MRILSIDGGGIRGLIPAVILAHVERRAGQPLAGMVDLVAGTSTGGIIAAAVAARIPMEQVRQLYRERGREIFSRSWARRLLTLGGLRDEKYSARGLTSALCELFGERRLSQAATELLVPATTLGGAPYFFKSRKARTDVSQDFLLADVCRATSAAPTYFPPAEVTDLAGVMTRHLVDGGLVANNPAMCALAEAVRGVDCAPVLVSLGTGADDSGMSLARARRCGLLSGGAGVLKMVFNGPGHAVDYQCREVLGDLYHRIQPSLPGTVDLDATDEGALALMEDVAARICELPEFERMFNSLTRPQDGREAHDA